LEIIVLISGGKICMTDHFQPLWVRNVPRFGIAHALALGVSNRSILSLSIHSIRFDLARSLACR